MSESGQRLRELVGRLGEVSGGFECGLKEWGLSGVRVLGVRVVVRERVSGVRGVSERVWWEGGVKE